MIEARGTAQLVRETQFEGQRQIPKPKPINGLPARLFPHANVTGSQHNLGPLKVSCNCWLRCLVLAVVVADAAARRTKSAEQKQSPASTESGTRGRRGMPLFEEVLEIQNFAPDVRDSMRGSPAITAKKTRMKSE